MMLPPTERSLGGPFIVLVLLGHFDFRFVWAGVNPSSRVQSGTQVDGRRGIQEDPTNDTRLQCPSPSTTDSRELNSFLWVVTDRSRPSYFFGTIHVPYTRVWDYIPSNSKQAFRQADSVYLELDLLDAETVIALHRCQLLPAGKLLADVIPRPLYRRLKRHLQYVRVALPSWMTADQRGLGLYPDYLFDALTGNWERKRPIYVMLMVNSLTEGDVRLRGTPVLDVYLAQEAQRLKKNRGAVELVEDHCLPLNDMNLSQVLFALNHTLSLHEGHRFGTSVVANRSHHTTDELVYHYNCGDLDQVLFSQDTTQVPTLLLQSPNGTLATAGELDTARQIDDYFRDELIFKRNQKMAERVDRLLKENPSTSFFFAFGAGHFIGNRSVIDLLRQKGYNISHAPPGEHTQWHTSLPRQSKDVVDPVSTFGPSRDPVLISVLGGNHAQQVFPNIRAKPTIRHDRRKAGHRLWAVPLSDNAPVTDSLHLKRSQFNDLWIRLEEANFDAGSFIRQQMGPTSQRANQITMTTWQSSTSAASFMTSLDTALSAIVLTLAKLSLT